MHPTFVFCKRFEGQQIRLHHFCDFCHGLVFVKTSSVDVAMEMRIRVLLILDTASECKAEPCETTCRKHVVAKRIGARTETSVAPWADRTHLHAQCPRQQERHRMRKGKDDGPGIARHGFTSCLVLRQLEDYVVTWTCAKILRRFALLRVEKLLLSSNLIPMPGSHWRKRERRIAVAE